MYYCIDISNIFVTNRMNYSVAERTLEDHEDILAVHRELEMFASQYERRFYFSQDFLKYEVFIKPVVNKNTENFVTLQKKAAVLIIHF